MKKLWIGESKNIKENECDQLLLINNIIPKFSDIWLREIHIIFSYVCVRKYKKK